MSNTLSGLSRTAERDLQNKQQVKIANVFTLGYEREIKRAMNAAADLYKSDESDAVLMSALIGHTDNLDKLVTKNWQTSSSTSGRRTLSSAKAIDNSVEVKSSLTDLFSDAVLFYIETQALKRVTGLAKTTIEDVRRVIKTGKANDESVDQIAKNIKKAAVTKSASRAFTIARTETHAAYNFGGSVAAEMSGLNMKKEWVSASDDRTRQDEFDHVSADGEVVNINDMFMMTGEPMQYPGDPSGSPGNVINCRCARVDVLV